MTATTATIKVPVYVRVAGREIELGVLDLDVKVQPSGRLSAPQPREIKAALRKGLH